MALLLLAHIVAAADPSRTILCTPIVAERHTSNAGGDGMRPHDRRLDERHQSRQRDQGKSGPHL
jgi:hypothetical protein